MYRIIGGDGREYGPVAAAQVEQWIAQNRANTGTQIKAEGAADWTTLGALPEFAATLAARPAPPPLPGQPGEPTAATNPVAGFAPPSPAPANTARRNPADEARDRVGRDYRFSVFDSISRGWDLMAGRFWLVVGGTLLGAIANGAAGSLPLVGIIASIVLTQVFYAGIYWLILRVARGEPAEIGDVFAGFTRSFGELAKLSATMFGCMLSLALVGLGPLLWVLLQCGVLHGGKPEPAQLLLPLLAMPVLMIPMVYFSVSWIFAPILVIDRGLGFWEALEISRRVVSRHWFRFFLLYLAFFPLMIAGLLCFIVGIFVVAALMYATVAAAYQTAFSDEAAKPAANHPRGADELRG